LSLFLSWLSSLLFTDPLKGVLWNDVLLVTWGFQKVK
jgi:hypothetical protein